MVLKYEYKTMQEDHLSIMQTISFEFYKNINRISNGQEEIMKRSIKKLYIISIEFYIFCKNSFSFST